jgi:putative RecB family exonuclease
MTAPKLNNLTHLSVSAVSDYLDCGLLYKLSRVDKLLPEFKADALLFGTAIHAALAEFYQALRECRKMSAKELQEIFSAHWQRLAKDREDILYKNDKDFDTLLLEGKELLSAYHHQLPLDEGSIIAIEEAFTFWIEGLPIPIIGIYDLVLEDPAGVITIVDHKTTARAYSLGEVERNLQLTVYQMAARANGYEDREILLRLDCLIKTKTPRFEQFYSTRSAFEEMKAVKKILAVWQGISQGVFIPNEESWKCAGCAYKSACEAWFVGGEDGT